MLPLWLHPWNILLGRRRDETANEGAINNKIDGSGTGVGSGFEIGPLQVPGTLDPA